MLTSHKLFKVVVLFINHRKVKRQLLIKSVVQTTIRLALDEAFIHTNSILTASLQLLQQKYSKLFQNLISNLEISSSNESKKKKALYVDDLNHVRSLVHNKKSSKKIKKNNLQ